jgi:hypothetical protein
LNQTSEGSVGIKLREGRLEIKERRQQHGTIRLHPQASGTLEAWYKWSFPLAEGEGLLPKSGEAKASWTRVWKERSLHRYRLAGDRSPSTGSQGEWPVQAVDLELTGLKLRGQPWWTLGLEAYGQGENLHQNLMLVAAVVLSGDLPLTLKAQDSYAYPEWLEKT